MLLGAGGPKNQGDQNDSVRVPTFAAVQGARKIRVTKTSGDIGPVTCLVQGARKIRVTKTNDRPARSPVRCRGPEKSG